MPSGNFFTFMCRFPGQISARPATSKSPDCASFTRMGQLSSSLLANSSVNPSGMCCTTRMLPENSTGSCENRYCKAFGPPVETPRAMMRVGATGCGLCGCSPCVSDGRNCVCTPALCAAARIFLINSAAISGMRAKTSFGLATKSNAPSASALRVIAAPAVLCELTTITGRRQRRMISFRVSIPFSPGISRSSVITCGDKSSIFFNAKWPSIAVPTTSIESSRSRMLGISLRIRAESSTTRTRTGFLMPGPRPFHAPASHQSGFRQRSTLLLLVRHSTADPPSAARLRPPAHA